MKTIILFYNSSKPEAARWVTPVRKLFTARGIKVIMGAEGKASREQLQAVDIAVALGGDGTMLRAARLLAPLSIPLLGINAGGLGFLSGADAGDLKRQLGKILDGDYILEERRLLAAEVLRGGRKTFGPLIALNDCVIKSSDPRAFFLRATLGGQLLTDYFGDGVIVSTPTGSTAYALAAQGPIVDPRLDVVVIAPICPHTLTQRPLVLPADQPLSVKIVERRPRERVQALLSLDGQINTPLKIDDEIRITKYDKPFKLLLGPKRSYFEILRRKLKWGER